MATNNASNPYPPTRDINGAAPHLLLSWIAGDNAAVTNGHDLYFGTDHAAVLNGAPMVSIGLQTDPNWAPPSLSAGTTYYWRVDEVNPGVAPFRWQGSVWSFTVFDGAGQPAGYENGYATWCVNTMTQVNLTDSLPAGSPSPPAVGIKLAQCESTGFQVAIQPASGRRLDHVRLVISDLTSGANTLTANNISWQVVGLITYLDGKIYADIPMPVSDFNAAAGNTHSMLVTVQAPANAPAGVYSGTIKIKSDSGLDTTVNVSATVYGFAIPAASTVGSMHLRTTWTLDQGQFGTPADYQTYGDFLLSYRMCPDNIYSNATPVVSTLEHWYALGLNTFTACKADSLWHTGGPLTIASFFTDLAASPHGNELRKMAQFYGYDEKDRDTGPFPYGDSAGQAGMRANYGAIKAAYPDIPTMTTCHMYLPPWADPLGDMTHYHCDWICAGQSFYNYADGELLRGAVDPGIPNNQRFQYWAYNAAFGVGKLLIARTTFWSLFQQKADGFLYYSVNGWSALSNQAPIDPATGPIINYAYVAKSAAVLMYQSTAGPLASLRMVNIRDGMQDLEYLWAIGHFDTDGVTRLGKIASVETARELAEKISVDWTTDTDPAHVISAREVIAAWLTQPYVARYPTPEHRSKGVSVNPTLTWQGDSINVDSFNVYFGTDGNAVLNATTASPEFKGNQIATTFSPLGALATNTNYYWRIDEVVGAQVYKGYVWSLNCSYGLVGWWKFDESTGTTAKDSSTLGRDAAIANADHVTGILNNALRFTGVGSVSIPISVLSTVDRQISIAFWLYGAAAQPQGEVIFEALTANGDAVLRGRLPFSDAVAYFEAGVSDVVSRPMTLTQAKSRWQYWAFTKNADTGHMRIYFNGALWAEATGNTQIMGQATAFTVGSKCDGSLGYEGNIDELRVYDSELQLADITGLYSIGGHRGDCGLMGWWRFDELSGTSAKDWSDLQNHGTLRSAGQSRAAGKIGNCLTCNGANDYVDIPVDGMTFSDPAVSVALWTYGDSSLPIVNSNYGSIAISALKTDGTTALLAIIPSGDARAFFRAGGDSGADTKITNILPAAAYKDQWNHWVFARDSSGLASIYLNGSLLWADKNSSGDVCGTIGQFRIGTGCAQYETYNYVGKLDEVRLYNYALAAAEVEVIYTADSTNFSGQVGRWEFDENTGSLGPSVAITADATQFGNHGTIDGASWSQGRIGSALRFDGIDDNVSIPAASLTSLDKQVTVTLWLNGAPVAPNDTWIFDAEDATDGPTIRATVGRRLVAFDAGVGANGHIDAVEWDALQSDPTGLAPAPPSLPVGQWSHWAFTKNAISGSMNIYLNGLPWRSAAGKYRPLTSADEFKIGSKADGTSSYGGVIDDVHIYNLELNPSDIYNIYLDCPPLPNPMTWSSVPQRAGETSISMVATAASHPNGVEYYFECVGGGGHDSGWQTSPSYTDFRLAALTQYRYQVKARETGSKQNETGFSSVESATTDP